MATKRKTGTVRLTEVAPLSNSGFRDFIDSCSWAEDPGRFWADTELLQALKERLDWHETGVPRMSVSRFEDEALDPVGALADDVIQAVVDEIVAKYVGWQFASSEGTIGERLDAHFALVIAHGALLAEQRKTDLEEWARRDAEHKVAMADAERRSFGLS